MNDFVSLDCVVPPAQYQQDTVALAVIVCRPTARLKVPTALLDPVETIRPLKSTILTVTRRDVKDAFPVTTTLVVDGSAIVALLAGCAIVIVQPPKATATTTSRKARIVWGEIVSIEGMSPTSVFTILTWPRRTTA